MAGPASSARAATAWADVSSLSVIDCLNLFQLVQCFELCFLFGAGIEGPAFSSRDAPAGVPGDTSAWPSNQSQCMFVLLSYKHRHH